MDRPFHIKGLRLNLLLLFCSITFALVLGEVLARYRGIERLFPDSPFLYAIGRDLLANAETQRFCDEVCIRDRHNIHLRQNSIGVRDIDHNINKPEDVRRIVILGDSMTSAEEVPIEQTTFRQLQTLLNQKSREKWEVISLGLRGAGTLEEVMILEEFGLKYNPDVILLQTYINNDLFNNSIKAAGVCEIKPYRPYMVKGDDGRWYRTSSQSFRNFLRHRSALFIALETVFLRLKYRIDKPLTPFILEELLEEEMRDRRADLPVDCFTFDMIPDVHQPPLVFHGWEVTEMLITHLAQDLHMRGIPLIAYDVPSTPLMWNQESHEWQNFANTASVLLVRTYGLKRLESLFSHLGVPFIPLLPLFEEKRDAIWPYWNYHLTPSGHRLVAEAVFKVLRDRGLVHSQ